MEFHFISLLSWSVALIGGATIGYGFGVLQEIGRRRHELRAQSGKLKNMWSLMPGSGTRVAYLLIALALVQLICPLLFRDGTQWRGSAGVMLGYGWVFFLQLGPRRA